MNNRKTDIILAGVGGQGILSIAAAIGLAAVHENLSLKQSEVHGMSQRGGAVQSHLRLSATEIASDLIPLGQADLIISLEPMEALRYLPFLASSGWLITNTGTFINIPDYPKESAIFEEIRKIPHHMLVPASNLAKDAGNPKSSNMVMLGAAFPFLNLSKESLIFAIRKLFHSKGEELVQSNISAFEMGAVYKR